MGRGRAAGAVARRRRAAGSFVIPTGFDWHLLAGDDTALPAIARRLEELPAGARADVILEAPEPSARIEFATRRRCGSNGSIATPRPRGRTLSPAPCGTSRFPKARAISGPPARRPRSAPCGATSASSGAGTRRASAPPPTGNAARSQFTKTSRTEFRRIPADRRPLYCEDAGAISSYERLRLHCGRAFRLDKMTILSVRHVTTYSYAVPVRLGEHRMMLRPRDSNDQRLLRRGSRRSIPALAPALDPRRVRQLRRGRRFRRAKPIGCAWRATSPSSTGNLSEPEVLLDESARNYPFSYDLEEMPDLARSIQRHHPDPDGEVDRWARRFVNSGGPTETGALLMTLTYAIKESFTYERREREGNAEPRRRRWRRGAARAAISRP